MKVGLRSLLQKANLYELLATLQWCVDQVVESTPAKPLAPHSEDYQTEMAAQTSEGGSKEQSAEERGEGEGGEGMETESQSQPVSVEVVKKIVCSLEELKKSIEKSTETLLPPAKSLPSSVPSQSLSHERREVFSGLMRMFQSR